MTVREANYGKRPAGSTRTTGWAGVRFIYREATLPRCRRARQPHGRDAAAVVAWPKALGLGRLSDHGERLEHASRRRGAAVPAPATSTATATTTSSSLTSLQQRHGRGMGRLRVARRSATTSTRYSPGFRGFSVIDGAAVRQGGARRWSGIG